MTRHAAEESSPASQIGHALEHALEHAIERVLRRVLHEQDPDWIPQGKSPLGPKRHCAAVRRRIAERKPGARIVARRFLLSQEAMAEELGRESERHSGRPTVKKAARVAPANDAETADLDLELLAKLGFR
jgi:hypothetical protein